MSDRLLCVVGNEVLELALCSLVVEEGAAHIAKQRRELRPGIRRTHVDDTNGVDARAWRPAIDYRGTFTCLDAAPEFLFGRNQQAEIERVHGDGDFYPLAAASNDGQNRGP